MLTLGLRLGESQSIAIKDVDLVKKEITISRQIVSKGIKDVKHAVVTSLKTTSSYRTIPLSDKLYEAIKKHLESHPNARPDDYLFFCSATPQSRTTLRRIFNKYIKESGVPKITYNIFLG